MAAPAPSPQPDSIILSKFDGLKNTISRERLAATDLERAINVDLDDSGQFRRRRGYRQVASGSYHSLFTSDDGTVYGVLNGTLGIIRPDYSFFSLGRTVGGDPTIGENSVAYAEVGPILYYTCATDAGKVDTRLAIPQAVNWGPSQDFWLSPVVNPTATLPAIRGRLLGAPPLASYLTYWHGRLYLGQGSTVWATELWLYDLVDKTRNFFTFEGDITMMGSVNDGYYVGTTEGLWYCGGDFPQKTQKVMDSGVIPGSMVYIPAELANPPQIGLGQDTQLQVSIAFLTTTGWCVAQEQGETYNLTESKFIFPVAQRAAAMFRRQDGINQYIAVTDSLGDPANNAAIGDYVEADIIRFKGAWVDEQDNFLVSDRVSAGFISGVGPLDEARIYDALSVILVPGNRTAEADGFATVAGVGASLAATHGNADGSASVSASSINPTPATGFANGGATVAGVGVSPFFASASATGAASVAGVSTVITKAVGNADGSASVSGSGLPGIANADGSASVSGIGAAIKKSPGAADGAASVTGVSLGIVYSHGNANGSASVSGIGVSAATSLSVTNGAASVAGVGASLMAEPGAANGSASVSGIGALLAAAHGNADGAANVQETEMASITQTTVTSNTAFGSQLPANGAILFAIIRETAGHNVNISLGKTSGATDVMPAQTVAASGTIVVPVGAFSAVWFSAGSAQTIYINSSAWGSASVNVEIVYQPGP